MSSVSSSRVTIGPVKGVRGIGMVTIVAGVVMVLAGLGVWILVSMTLADENITVSDDARMFAGQQVAGPFTAYAQAEVIDKHATEMADGQTYAELPQDDPLRDTVMNASFLRASLFTSVVAFGVCALVVGLGILFVLLGGALRRLAGGPQVAVETPGLSSHGDLSASGRHADEPPTSPLPPTPPGPPPTRSSSRPAPDAPTPGSSDRPPAAPPVAGPETGPGTPRPSDPGDGPRA
ncbi:hypothetical protein [Isoptericola sp. BMS4]|uniref:hypothetical protein n=1 Tax=Isoptericola sp. BMS4 TaxID=2527875 RepID=UPI00351A22AE